MPHLISQNLSPQERRHIAILSPSPGRGFRFDRERPPPFTRQNTPAAPVMLYSMHTDPDGRSSDTPTVPALIQSTGNPMAQMFAMTQETHARCLALEDSMASETGTQVAYARHLKSYETWWNSDQSRRREEDSTLDHIPPHPITATKVALFLEFETIRPKVSVY